MGHLQELVGRKIKELRKQSGYTLDELGEKLGMKGHSVWRLETGRRAPSLELVEQLAETFSVPPAYFFNDGNSSQSQEIDPNDLDPVIRDLWEELHQCFEHEHPITREHAVAALRALLNIFSASGAGRP